MKRPKQLRKQGLALLTSLMMVLVLTACGGAEPNNTTTIANTPTPTTNAADSTTTTADDSETGESELVLTLDELSAFNGKNGQPAYVAVDGVIYDFTDLGRWTNGEHAGQFEAGNDLTEEIDELSPHGRDVLDRAPIVGRLAD